MSTQQLCVKWNNHQVNMLGVFGELLDGDNFVDVTLACEGESLKAHKMVLSACSPFFRDLLVNNPCQHPIIILSNVNFKNVKMLIEFMYKGQVQIPKDKLQDLLKTAEILKLKGLGEVGKNGKASPKVPPAPSPPPPPNRKQGDHHYSCSTSKGKKRKNASAVSDVKVVETVANEDLLTETISEEIKDDTTAPPVAEPEIASDAVICEDENVLTSINVEQDSLEQDVNMSALEKTDPNFAEETESCVLMPLVDADENSISELSVSQLEGRQLAQVTDESGNTLLVLIPEPGPSELPQPVSDDVMDAEILKKSGKRKRQRDAKSEDPDYTEIHFKKSDGTTMKLYQCLQCDSKFANRGNVRRHTYSAHKGYRIQCEVCNALFTQKSSKDAHFRTVHAGMRYYCDKCESQFTEKRRLLHHISAVHQPTTN